LATAKDTAEEGQLVIAPFDPTKTIGRHFIVGHDGYIRLAANTNLVLDVQSNVANEGQPVILFPQKHDETVNQKWVEKTGIITSALANGEYTLGVNPADNKVIITKGIPWVIPYEGHIEGTQGETINTLSPFYSSFTVTAVVTLDKAPWSGRIWDKITAGTGDGFLLDIYPAYTVRAISGQAITSPTKIAANTPVYLAATYGLPQVSIYQNGVKTISQAAPVPPQNKLPLRLGFDSNGQNVFPGIIRRARIYPTPLSDAQVQADYERAKAELNF